MMKSMKGFVFSLVFASVLVMSCEKHGQDTENQAICFDVIETKSLATADAIKANGSQMTVRGVYDGSGSDLIILFDDQAVTSTGSGWNYSPMRYWIPGKTMRFAALWPSSSRCTLDGDLSSKVRMSSFTQGVSPSGQTDLLMANPVQASSGSVNFNFRHLMSNIRFEIDKNAPTSTVWVTKVTVEDAHNTGSLEMTSGDGVNWTDTWTLDPSLVDLSTGTLDSPVPLTQTDGSTTFQSIPSDGFLAIPQRVNESASNTKLTVSVRIRDDQGVMDTKDIVATLPKYPENGGEWVAGKKIVYRLTVDENYKIIFGKPEVAPWGSTQTSGAIVIK